MSDARLKQQKRMCAGGPRGKDDWGAVLNYHDLKKWARKGYAKVDSVVSWYRFCDDLLVHMDRMHGYVGGAEKVLLYRIISKGPKGSYVSAGMR